MGDVAIDIAAFNAAYNRRQQIRALDAPFHRVEACARCAPESCRGHGLFDQQLNFLSDPGYWKAVLCARRSGKTSVFGVSLLRQAWRFPRRKFLYLGLTKESAEEAIWTDTLERILLENFDEDDYTYHYSEHVLTLRNGSSIRLGGVDASPRDMNRLLGRKYHEVIIDECQDIKQDLRVLVDSKLQPLVNDYRLHGGGRIILGGTPGLDMSPTNFWHMLTKHGLDFEPHPDRYKGPGWKVFEWNCWDNPYYRAEFEDYCRALALVDPFYRQDPTFIRQYLGKWVANDATHIYKYYEGCNLEDGDLKDSLLRGDPRWTYIFGVDLGWKDYSGVVVLAYSFEDPTCYVVEAHKLQSVDAHDVSLVLHHLREHYHPVKILCDAGSGTGLFSAESLRYPRDEHGRKLEGLPVHPAAKTEKEAATKAMNSDFRSMRLRVIAERCPDLIQEWTHLQVDPRALLLGVFGERRGDPNHLADSALYAYRESRHRFGDVPKAKAAPTSADILIAKVRRRNGDDSGRDRLEAKRYERKAISRYR